MRMIDIPPDRPVLIAGPTASGKSALAARIVRDGGGIVVNADALQVYANWRILTARPSVPEEQALPHALYGHVARDAEYSVGHWLRGVTGILNGPLRPVIVGGTGLYFTALTEGLAPIPATPPQIRAEGDGLALPDLIHELDVDTARGIDLNNRARVQRAWEVLRATGQGLASWQADTPPPLLPLGDVEALVLRPSTAWLDARIDRRFDLMMAEGALEEARTELPHWQPTRPSSRAIGAPELIAHLRGEMTLKDAVAAGKLATRQYAKRQRTWFRNRMRDWTELTPENTG
ncbi:tRNA (adenosine(37)-N6)-dimethylallyltransferase MiaA [Falsirhodobacter sp. 20TX0035]|uniref:tRNA (adenosine(37)-N6)-dimethylallyltransferase MiaA n=1 Tax=Falsirhodobacter sp. 20TX0035 TaxID=3022019 RepID=UPI00232ABFA0|nr:tRNA (adenosine(37)-N6)-dimethylallyltransferase MiaA [Falsirhodobacter sp. 20TX0035]MDB6453414.1 tRNA (adenosine(37)-N6)-dimethylallyltransferase MiaA [Falsirhodobacter sp. 20TX0035]